jgi:hypothetical protein
MVSRQNGKLIKWRVDVTWQVNKMASQQNGKSTKWQVNKMASQQNGKLMKWQVGKMASS